MGKLTKEEAEQLAALQAKQSAPDEPEPDDDDDQDDDDGGVIVLRGKRADSFLTSLFGTGKRTRRSNAGSPPASTDGDGDGDGDGEPEPPEPQPRATHRYFR